ncbi:MAG: hypothetical protein CMF59_02935 [Leptospiraceae bacterium]|nr:hypothetical protein [Leptospiraceae bacterium]
MSTPHIHHQADMNTVFLSHTDIRTDSRILKEMESIKKRFQAWNVSGIGLAPNTLDNGVQKNSEMHIDAILLRTRRWWLVPGIIRRMIIYIEMVLRMMSFLRRSKPDILHCSDTIVLPVAVIGKLLSGAKLIYDAHELESDRNGLTKLQGRVILFLEKTLWRFVDALIVVSPSIGSWYSENVGPKLQETILNAPILSESDSSDSNYLRSTFGVPSDCLIFIYVGLFVPGRGIGELLAAIKKSSLRSHFVFLGYGSLQDEIETAAREKLNIHIHPRVRHDEVVKVIRGADAGICLIENVSLSDYYSLPNKLFEYAFAGVPVIASRFPEIERTVREYSLGVCTDSDSNSIAKVLDGIERKGTLPKPDALRIQDLSWSAQEEKLVELYGSLIGSRSHDVGDGSEKYTLRDEARQRQDH